MPTIHYSARSARLSVHKLFTSCIRRGLVSHDLIVDGDWRHATEWCQRYRPCCQPASNVAENLKGLLYRAYRPGEWLWIDSNGRNRNHTFRTVEGYFGREFLAICNHCGVMAAWSRKTLKKFWEVFAFWEKQPFTVKFSKFYSERFHQDNDRRLVFKFRDI